MKEKTKSEDERGPRLQMEIGDAWISIRIKGDSEHCTECGKEIEIFTEEAAKARFLIVKETDRIYLGGGQCLECKLFVCIRCAIKTIYGEGIYRLHCPQCGKLLSGLRRSPDDNSYSLGAILQEPDFGGTADEDKSNSA